MPCDTFLKPQETIQMRVATIRQKTLELSTALAAGTVKPVIGPQGAIAFQGWQDRDGITDVCAYRRIMATGSARAKAAIMKAELLSGRTVSKQALAVGVHSHDGGRTWHGHKG